MDSGVRSCVYSGSRDKVGKIVGSCVGSRDKVDRRVGSGAGWMTSSGVYLGPRAPGITRPAPATLTRGDHRGDHRMISWQGRLTGLSACGG